MAATPPDPDSSWSELTDQAIALGDQLKHTYRRVADESGPSEEEIRQAFATLGAAWSQIAGSIGVALSDEAVRNQARQAGLALWTAISSSLTPMAEGEE